MSLRALSVCVSFSCHSRVPFSLSFFLAISRISPSLAIRLGASLPVSVSCLSAPIIPVDFLDPSHLIYRLVLF